MKRKHILDRGDAHEIVSRDADNQHSGSDLATEQRSGVSRRRFLLAGAATLVAASPSAVDAQHKPGSPQGRTRARTVAAAPAAPLVQFKEPKPLGSENGKLTVPLDAVWASWPFSCTGTPPTDQVPTYNGQVIGPTLYIRPGDQIHFTLQNRLTTNPFTGDHCVQNMHLNPPFPVCFTQTNWLLHVLLVSPFIVLKTTLPPNHCIWHGVCLLINSTQVRCATNSFLLDIAPGRSSEYQIQVPGFPESGTYWYHSHLHGS